MLRPTQSTNWFESASYFSVSVPFSFCSLCVGPFCLLTMTACHSVSFISNGQEYVPGSQIPWFQVLAVLVQSDL